MPHYHRYILAAPMILLAAGVHAQGLKDAQPTLNVGNWTVLRSIDSMTDKVGCTWIYKSDYGVQLAANALYVKVCGGLQSVTLYFGDEPARRMRIPSELEKKVGPITIGGDEFSDALRTNRVRVQALTLVGGLVSEDLDTTGMQQAIEHILAGCPPSSDTSRPPTSTETLCSDELQARLRATGVTAEQLAAACRK